MISVFVIVIVFVKIRVNVENSLENFHQNIIGRDAKYHRKEKIL